MPIINKEIYTAELKNTRTLLQLCLWLQKYLNLFIDTNNEMMNSKITNINIKEAAATEEYTDYYIEFIRNDGETFTTDTFRVYNGEQGIQGPKGADGVSIYNLSFNSASQNNGYTESVIQVTMTDDSFKDFIVKAKNGENGDTIESITNIGEKQDNGYTVTILDTVMEKTGHLPNIEVRAKNGIDGLTIKEFSILNIRDVVDYTITDILVTFSNDSTTTFGVYSKNGEQGPKGDTGATGPQGNPGIQGADGISIANMSFNSASQNNGYTESVIQVTMTDDSFKDFIVKAKNGENGDTIESITNIGERQDNGYTVTILDTVMEKAGHLPNIEVRAKNGTNALQNFVHYIYLTCSNANRNEYGMIYITIMNSSNEPFTLQTLSDYAYIFRSYSFGYLNGYLENSNGERKMCLSFIADSNNYLFYDLYDNEYSFTYNDMHIIDTVK